MLAAVLLMLGFGAAPASAAAASESVLRLREAVARHPEDPDLAWALAVALVRAGDPEAEAQVERFELRWPGRRPEAAVYLGRIRYETGRPAEALEALDRALGLDPESAEAHLYRALALLQLGRREAVEDALDEAERWASDAKLRSAVRRLRTRLRQDDALLANGSAALAPERAIDEARPDSDGTRGQHGEPGRAFAGRARPAGLLRSSLSAGVEWDSNPERLNGGGVTGNDDFKGVWGTGLSVHPSLGEHVRLGAGYRYRGQRHLDTHEQDRQQHQGFAAASWRLAEGVHAHALTLGGYDQREGDSYRWLVYARPSVSFQVGPRLGIGQLYGSVEYADFLVAPAARSLVLDGLSWDVGYRHRAVIPGWPRARATLGVQHAWLRTEGGRDTRGFGSAYDNRDLEGRLALEVMLPGRIRAEGSGSLGRSWYRHRNAIDFAGGGTGRARRDLWLGWRLGVSRPLNGMIDLEVSYSGVDTDSNVRLYDYTRHVLAVELGVVWNMRRLPVWKPSID